MPYLAAALVLVTALCLLNLVLTMGVIRRLRADAGHRSLAPSAAERAVGNSVGEFLATSVTGVAVDHGRLDGRAVVGFFTPGCRPCAEQLPEFERLARRLGADRVLGVVVGDGAACDADAARLSAVAPVVVERPGGPVSTAFSVDAFPSLFEVRNGTVVAAGHAVSALGAP